MKKYNVSKTTVENRSSRDNSPLEIYSETIQSFTNEKDAETFLSTVELPEPHHDDIDVFKEIIEVEYEGVDELVDQYRADPNCSPIDWIASEHHLSAQEKDEFLKKVSAK